MLSRAALAAAEAAAVAAEFASEAAVEASRAALAARVVCSWMFLKCPKFLVCKASLASDCSRAACSEVLVIRMWILGRFGWVSFVL